jgi:hypothetical protein
MKTDRRSFLKSAGVAGAGIITAGSAAGQVAAAPTVDAKPQAVSTELFLDNHLLEVTPSVYRKLHPPKKHLLNPVIRCERWCDGNNLQPYTTMYDEEDKLFKMWSRAGSDWKAGYVGGNAAYMLYFTSKDGVHWEKPDLGVIEVDGRRDHNIVFCSDLVLTSPTARLYGSKDYVVSNAPVTPQGKKAFFWGVNKHPHPRDESERYVGLAIVQDHRRGAHIVTSPDGLHWSCSPTPFWQTPHDVSSHGDDCLMHLIYDQAKQKWVIYRRIIPEFSERMVADQSDITRPAVDRYYRSYAYAESDNLEEWTNHQFILAMDPDDAPDTELYQFACQQIGPQYVGYMSVYYLRRPQPIDVQLAVSRDGVNFTRVCRGQPYISAGLPAYYDVMAMACSQPTPIVVGDTNYMYYVAANFPHDVDMDRSDPKVLQCNVALATFKRDRYASLETSSVDTGPHRVITKPFTVQHPKLFLNAATWNSGAIRVEALTPDWKPIPGFTEADSREIRGDALDHPVRWQNNADVSQLIGKQIRLKCYMTRARIHALTLANSDRPLGEVEPEYRNDFNADSAPKLT